jgi:hypothetical protein
VIGRKDHFLTEGPVGQWGVALDRSAADKSDGQEDDVCLRQLLH